jgi:hypothetical protein
LELKKPGFKVDLLQPEGHALLFLLLAALCFSSSFVLCLDHALHWFWRFIGVYAPTWLRIQQQLVLILLLLL